MIIRTGNTIIFTIRHVRTLRCLLVDWKRAVSSTCPRQACFSLFKNSIAPIHVYVYAVCRGISREKVMKFAGPNYSFKGEIIEIKMGESDLKICLAY